MNTPIPLWLALAIFFTALALSSAQEWFGDQYEATRSGRLGRRITRRWYGTHAHVTLRSNPRQGFRVVTWSDEDTEVPWLLVVLYRGTSWRLSEEGTGEPKPFWAPVTMFAPHTVRRLRPHILRAEHYRFPRLLDYRPLPGASCYPEDVRDAA